MTSLAPSLLPDLVQERLRCHADVHETLCLPPGNSLRATQAGCLATKLDGVPLLSLHLNTSCKSFAFRGSEQTTRGFHAGGQVIQQTGN